MKRSEIAELAEAAGIASAWRNAHGAPQQVAPLVLAAILDGLGLPCRSAAQYRDSAARLTAQLEASSLPPLLTAQVGQPIELSVGKQCALYGQHYHIAFEGGGSRQGRFPSDCSLPLTLPPLEKYGYHRLVSGKQSTVLAVAPSRCFGVADAVVGNADAAHLPEVQAHLWGLAVQLYSLRRQGDGGLSDFTALAMLARDAAQQGAAALAISPIHAMFSADPHRYSPYGPSSRLFLNALYVDPAMALGIDADYQDHTEYPALIDWPSAAGTRLALLRLAYSRFLRRGPNHEFETFCREGGTALQDHACYEALQEWLPLQADPVVAPDTDDSMQPDYGDWRRWPSAYRDPRSAKVAVFAATHRQQCGFHLFLQWQAARGLIAAQGAARAAGMPIGLITDLAIGAERGGSQSWAAGDAMLASLTIGAPPDLLNVHGQNWGLGAYSPLRLQSSGFGSFIAMLRACFAHAGGVRIDHVLGLARLWLVPDGASPADGAYVRYPFTDMLRLIALESWRYRAIVIGENLGTVPPGFDAQLARHNLLGISVLWFQREGMRFTAPQTWPATAVATTTTHDLPTVAGWWSETDIDWRLKLGLLKVGSSVADERELRQQERAALWQSMIENGRASGPQPPPTVASAPIDAALGLVGTTPAPLVLIPIEDMLGLPEQPNFPGTVGAIDGQRHPNWQRRLPTAVEQLFHMPVVQARVQRLQHARCAVALGTAQPAPLGHKESS